MKIVTTFFWAALTGMVSSRVTYIPRRKNPCSGNPCGAGQCLLVSAVSSLCACSADFYGSNCNYALRDRGLVSSSVDCYTQCKEYNLGRHGDVRCNSSKVIENGQVCEMNLYSEQKILKTITECQVIASLTTDLKSTAWTCNPTLHRGFAELFRVNITEVASLNGSAVNGRASRRRFLLNCWLPYDIQMRQAHLAYLGSETGWSLNNYTVLIPQQTQPVYIQIDLMNRSIVHQLILQPRGGDVEEWVTKIRVAFQPQAGVDHWDYVVDDSGNDQNFEVFPANESFAISPNNVTKDIIFTNPFVADRLRVVVFGYLSGYGPAMRMDVMGCEFKTKYT